MLVGYARVSTDDQNLHLQKDALTKAGCEKIFSDVMSGAKSQRDGLEQVIEYARPGDVIVVWRLDRLGRSLKDLIALVARFDTLEIGLKSLHESIDTTSSTGKLTFHIFGALAEFERNLIAERTKAGLDAARARGRLGGRPKALSKDREQLAVKLYKERDLTIDQICELVGISKPTLYKYVRSHEVSD